VPEYLELRCCMCPQKDNSSQICPGIPSTLHSEPTPCRFVKQYRDGRGWLYFVRGGIGGEEYKTFYVSPKSHRSGNGWRCVPWRTTFDEAQADLNRQAKRRGWQEVV